MGSLSGHRYSHEDPGQPGVPGGGRGQGQGPRPRVALQQDGGRGQVIQRSPVDVMAPWNRKLTIEQ